MLTLMNSANLISFSYDNKRWDWNLQKISAMNVPEDVVEFLLEELQNRNYAEFYFNCSSS